MYLGVSAAKVAYVRLKTLLIEPAEHLIEFLAQQEANRQHGKLLKLDWPVEDTTKDLGSFEIGKLASCDLKFESDELFRALKSQSREGSDIFRSNCLIRLVSTDGVHQLTFQDSNFNLVDVIVLHETGRPEYRCRQAELTNMLLNFPIALPMIDAGVPLCPANRTVDKMFYTGFFGSLREVLQKSWTL